MYAEAGCPDYSHMLPAGFQPPSAAQLARLLSAPSASLRALVCPRSPLPPPPPHAYAVAMLPAACAHLCPAPLRHLFAEESALACYFAAERCGRCVELRAALASLQKLREAETAQAR
eukprot:3542570-Prymnesium_polylepis.1